MKVLMEQAQPNRTKKPFVPIPIKTVATEVCRVTVGGGGASVLEVEFN